MFAKVFLISLLPKACNHKDVVYNEMIAGYDCTNVKMIGKELSQE